jgi:carboxymethylenebutenolidase
MLLALLLAACGGPGPDPGEAGTDVPAAGLPDAERDAAARIEREHAEDAPVATPAVASPPRSPVVARAVEYGREGEQALTGYLALPEAESGQPLPGIIVIHEWWGLNENIRAMTERLAGEGYAALAVDLYLGRTADEPEGASLLMRELTGERERGWRNLRQAHDYLAGYLEAPAVASLGWCLGGRWALEAARALPDAIDAVVIYYGNMPSEEEALAPLDMPILGLFAEEDAAVPLEGVFAFRDRLAELGKNAHIEIYPGVDHAFANPSGGNYHPETAEDAWQRTLAFLAAHLRDEDGPD